MAIAIAMFTYLLVEVDFGYDSDLMSWVMAAITSRVHGRRYEDIPEIGGHG